MIETISIFQKKDAAERGILFIGRKNWTLFPAAALLAAARKTHVKITMTPSPPGTPSAAGRKIHNKKLKI